MPREAQKESSYLGIAAGPCSKIPNTCAVIHMWSCQGLQIASLSTTPQVGASGSCSPNTKAVGRGAWICCRAFSQSGPAQIQQLEESLNRWARVTHPTEECTISKVQNVCLLALCSFLGWRQGQAQQLILCLGRGVPACLKPLTHTNFIDAKGP